LEKPVAFDAQASSSGKVRSIPEVMSGTNVYQNQTILRGNTGASGESAKELSATGS
jgi:hypothetical protein